ncbi:NADPH-dependent 7-cyano-7-deazaguanine reductase [Striga asiatica]|uniref:NADPH-dependent 7-cyano-7-deazaguanine reductase n=1 Tax=Striga asiatica TaxID=4170 RepID=A0A5A7Q1L1_STRAF|nr:NADPH-dependent 7-cyano-7-deazaguanine reductase [Striga asiatica]
MGRQAGETEWAGTTNQAQFSPIGAGSLVLYDSCGHSHKEPHSTCTMLKSRPLPTRCPEVLVRVTKGYLLAVRAWFAAKGTNSSRATSRTNTASSRSDYSPEAQIKAVSLNLNN